MPIIDSRQYRPGPMPDGMPMYIDAQPLFGVEARALHHADRTSKGFRLHPRRPEDDVVALVELHDTEARPSCYEADVSNDIALDVGRGGVVLPDSFSDALRLPPGTYNTNLTRQRNHWTVRFSPRPPNPRIVRWKEFRPTADHSFFEMWVGAGTTFLEKSLPNTEFLVVYADHVDFSSTVSDMHPSVVLELWNNDDWPEPTGADFTGDLFAKTDEPEVAVGNGLAADPGLSNGFPLEPGRYKVNISCWGRQAARTYGYFSEVDAKYGEDDEALWHTDPGAKVERWVVRFAPV
ncbi:hypothetical protein GCM10009799_33120 [Nocardiopsis rhodophaea]|uniref:Uncharacterized protein n=1 Tax=Nocardiopsis rhodophaea TaxID=280238 RepID=A0ABP5ENN7_9ACTN